MPGPPRAAPLAPTKPGSSAVTRARAPPLTRAGHDSFEFGALCLALFLRHFCVELRAGGGNGAGRGARQGEGRGEGQGGRVVKGRL